MLKLTKRPLALLLALIMTISVMPSNVSAEAADLPERVDVSLDDFSWSLETLDGRTINQDTYADKTVLFVFYRATLYNNAGICYNSNAIISDLAKSTWLDRDDIQIIAVDGDISNTAADVARYKEIYAPDCDDIDFAVNGNKLLWSLIRKVNPSAGTVTFAVCTVIKNNTICYEWDACTRASYCKDVLESMLGDFDNDTTNPSVTKVDLNVEKHTQAEIQAFIDANYASMSQPVKYSVEPSLNGPYAPGVLSDETAESALNLLNQARYIAGLNADVTLDPVKSEYAAAGMLLNYLNNELSHTPKRPDVLADTAYDDLYNMGYTGSSSSNIGWGHINMNQDIIHGWLADKSDSNIDRVGHRRWFLSPSMTMVGFGAAGKYTAAYVSGSFWNGNTNKYVAWPAQEMPVNYFSADYPWSVSLGYSLEDKSVSVSLVRKSDGQTWNFSDLYSDGAFYVNSERYGSPACIIFRPDSLDKISAGDSFDVNILITDSSETISIDYTVNFFALAERYVVTLTAGETDISGELLQELLEKNKTMDVVIKTAEGVEYSFAKGTMVVAEDKESYDFGVEIITDYESLENPFVTEDEFAFRINCNYKGALPGTARITIPVDSRWIGKKLYYYEIDENGAYQYLCRTTVSNDGTYTIKQEHCSSYVAAAKVPENLGDVDGKNGVTTDDALFILQYVVGIPQKNFIEKLADCDGFDGISTDDAFTVLKYTVGIIEEFS